MSNDWIAPIVVVLTFGCATLGLVMQRWLPELSDETRDLIKRVTGLVGTLTALVLGLLIVSTNSFYNNQKSATEVMAARLLQLDKVLRRYGPEAKPVRDQLKKSAIQIYEEDWGSGSDSPPTLDRGEEAIDALAAQLDSLEPTTPEQKARLLAATNIATSMGEQMLLTALQVTNPISWPFVTILVSWASLLFFGVGITVRRNGTAIAALAVGAFAVGSAVFLIVELSQPYRGVLRISPAPLQQAIAFLGQ